MTTVARRSWAESAWYGHCQQVLGWFLTVAGVPEPRHDELITDAVGDRLQCWIMPSSEVVDEIAARLAQHVVVSRGA